MIRDLHNELAIALSMVDLPVNRLTTPLGRLATDLLGFTEGLCTVVEVALIHVKQITLEVVTRVEQLRTPEVSIGHSPRPAEALVYRRDSAQAELHHADAATDRPPRKKTPAVPLSGPRIIPIRRPPPPDEAEPPKPSAIEAAPFPRQAFLDRYHEEAGQKPYIGPLARDDDVLQPPPSLQRTSACLTG